MVVDIEAVAAEVYEMLGRVELGTVVAVWNDGSLSCHNHLGFRVRRLADGSREEPLTSFVAAGVRPYAREIAARIDAALERRDRYNSA